MPSPNLKTTISAIAASVMLHTSASAVETNLAGSNLPPVPPAPAGAVTAESFKTPEGHAIAMAQMKEVAAYQRAFLSSAWGPVHKSRALAALDNLDRALDGGNDDQIFGAFRTFRDARGDFLLGRVGFFGTFAAPLAAVILLGYLRRDIMPRDVKKLLERPLGLDFKDREFVNEFLEPISSRADALRRSVDALAYIYVRTADEKAWNVAAKYQFAVALGIGAATIAAVGAGMMTGYTVLPLTAVVAGVLAGGAGLRNLAHVNFKERGQEMVKRYKKWDAARDEALD